MNTPVNFELAKKLKQSGYNEGCRAYYNPNGTLTRGSISFTNSMSVMFVSSPTIAEVVMWLYEKHWIWVSVDMVYEEPQTGFWYCIRESKENDSAIQSEEFNTPTEAYEAAIKYVLENLLANEKNI